MANFSIRAFKFLFTKPCLPRGKRKYYKTGCCELSVHMDLNCKLASQKIKTHTIAQTI